MNTRDILEKGNHLGRLIKESQMWLADIEREPKTEQTLEKIQMANEQHSKHTRELNELRKMCGMTTDDINEMHTKVNDIYVLIREMRKNDDAQYFRNTEKELSE